MFCMPGIIPGPPMCPCIPGCSAKPRLQIFEQASRPHRTKKKTARTHRHKTSIETAESRCSRRDQVRVLLIPSDPCSPDKNQQLHSTRVRPLPKKTTGPTYILWILKLVKCLRINDLVVAGFSPIFVERLHRVTEKSDAEYVTQPLSLPHVGDSCGLTGARRAASNRSEGNVPSCFFSQPQSRS